MSGYHCFPMHPHRGIETFTYLIQGEIDHKDSLGNSGKILDGCCQWMTAGSGILHQEMPQASDRILGLQLWINLPRKDKMVEPKYRDITVDMVPKVEEEAGTVAVVAGRYKNVEGATKGDYVDVRFLDMTLKPGYTWTVETKPSHTVFAYLVEGTCALTENNAMLSAKHAYLFTEGDAVALTGGPEGARLVLVSGKPLHEAVAWGGPIVMNSEDELREAFQGTEDLHITRLTMEPGRKPYAVPISERGRWKGWNDLLSSVLRYKPWRRWIYPLVSRR